MKTIPWEGPGAVPVLYKTPIISSPQLSDVLPAGSWQGRPAVLVGGGPSLEGFKWDTLRGYRTIGINLAFKSFTPTIAFSMDTRFLRWMQDGEYGPGTWEKFLTEPKYRAWLLTYTATVPAGIHVIKVFKNYKHGIDHMSFRMDEGIGHGINSGFGALNLAIVLGANPIYLLGYDMKHRADGKTHHHGGHPRKQDPEVLEKFKRIFVTHAPEIAKRGVRVINLNPNSALRCFPFSTPEEAL
jgi:hypothetical protein